MYEKQTIERMMRNAYIVIQNAGHPEFQPKLARFNYTPERIAGGQQLYDDTRTADDLQKQAYGEQLKATRDLRIRESEVRRYWMELVKMAKRALADIDNAIKDLGISGKRRTIFEEWISEANVFYNNALASPEILAKLAVFGITETHLQDGQAMLAELGPLKVVQEKKKSDAQRKTADRDKLLKELMQWRADLLTAARIVFKEDPQVLEAFTIKVYSPGYKKKTPVEPEPELEPAPTGDGGEIEETHNAITLNKLY